jgi:sugar phosphate isomerase/epimerase
MLTMQATRRGFLKVAAGMACGGSLLEPVLAGGAASAMQPLAVQLYTLGAELDADFEGTLRRIAELGFREVEAAGFHGREPQAFRNALGAAGLACHGAHVGFEGLRRDMARHAGAVAELGAEYLICPDSSARPRPAADSELHAQAAADGASRGMTLDDWRWFADTLNDLGVKAKREGVRLGYHNHVGDFAVHGGVVAYDELLRLTDPALVTMELDCAWATVGGASPAFYLRRHPRRIRQLHLKDVQAGFERGSIRGAKLADVGSGVVDWQPILVAARAAGVRSYVVERDPPFEGSPFDSLRASRAHLAGLQW